MTILTSKQQKFQEEVITFLHFEERIRKEGREKISKRGRGNKKGVENKIFKKTWEDLSRRALWASVVIPN